jgi:NAD(P)-dependent dehydrogenase (short-subunit alcohol dehydrogenase family)
MELAPLGIGVSVLCPGTVKTNIASSARNRQAAFGGAVTTPKAIGRKGEAAKGITIRQPEEVAAMVVRGVKANAPYVMTSAETREPVRLRTEALLAAFDEVDAYDASVAAQPVSV